MAILAIDQGTTSTRALLFDKTMAVRAQSQCDISASFPQSGYVEQDPEEIWLSVLSTVRSCLEQVQGTNVNPAAIGLTNQRETTIIWDKETGKTLHKAIVWQDRRTLKECDDLKKEGLATLVTKKTGLLPDPYFSATKLKWILDHYAGSRSHAEQGKLLFGTIDSFLIWRLTGGRRHVTDATNAARTMLYNIREGHWDEDICRRLKIPLAMLPEVLDCDDHFGMTERALFGTSLAIRGVAGDQQAATLGQACFRPGMVKATYGTGCFALLNTGDKLVESHNRLLGTIAYQFNGQPVYALEGAIFNAGTVVQWLRDSLRFISSASEVEALARQADPTQRVYLVPAFTGLGAPYWAAQCRGAVFGLNRNSGAAEIAKAALDSIAYQTRDLIEAMTSDWQEKEHDFVLRVDGGMTVNDQIMQTLADCLNAPVDRSIISETTALGVAWLAGQAVGLYPDQEEFSKSWKAQKRFKPENSEQWQEGYEGWLKAVRATMMV